VRSTTLGTAILSVSIVFAFVGVLFSNISFAIVGIVFVSCYVFAYRGFSSDLAGTDLQIDRKILADMSFADEPVAVAVEVLNRHSRTVHGTFTDLIPADCEIASGSNKVTMSLPPKSILRLSYTIIPSKRGSHAIDGMKIERIDPYGLFSEEQTIDRRSDFSVHTHRSSLDAAKKMAGKEHLEFSGVGRNVAVVLRELEFDGIRDYVPGDRARDIHWKLFSKLNKLMTKVYKKEGAVQTTVFVDCGRSMRLKRGEIAKLDHAVDVSMQLSNVLISSYHPTGAAIFDEVSIMDKIKPGLGRHQFEKIVKILRNAPPAVEYSEPPSAVSSEQTSRTKPSSNSRATPMTGQGQEFLSAVGQLSNSRTRARLGYGLDAAIKELIASSRGGEQLFIVATDLMSSREGVFVGAKVCQSTGNRMLVINLFDDWYGPELVGYDKERIERTYGNLDESIRAEAHLRRLGASYIRIGPADTATAIARSIRRGRT
jgi:uncharacterized protein (DUF58 family)